MTSSRYMRGLTFVELMATLLIVSVLAAIALPSFNNMLQGNRSLTQSELLLKSLNYARGEALRRNAEVRITSLSGTQDWGAQGWRVWVDTNKDNAFTNADQELQTQPALVGGATLIAPGIPELIFAGNGFLQKQAGYTFATALIFNFSVSGHCEQGRNITVMYAGRTIIEPAAC